MRRDIWIPALAGLFCFGWAFVAWLTVIPNQDILVDGIQVQSLVAEPRVVLAFPGQRHGGPLEYPATILAEWFLPGNYFANGAIRPLLAFLTGFLVGKLFLRLFPSAPSWAFLTGVAVGPTIIHGKLGPAGNEVGVWWLQPNWDMAWLLVTAGAFVLAGCPRSQSWVVKALSGGLLVGLGFWAHPAVILLIVPLLVLVTLLMRLTLRILMVGFIGSVIGVVPAGISYVINSGINTWDPSHGAFISLSYYRDMGGSVLGLNGVPDYIYALMPYAVGLPPSQDVLPGWFQSGFVWLVLGSVAVIATVSSVRALKKRQPVGDAGAVALSWSALVVTIMLFITFIDPVWIYSSSLAVLFWLTVGALPLLVPNELLGILLTSALLLVTAVSTLTHNWDYLTNLPREFQAKVAFQERNQTLAEDLVDEGANYIFGSYYEVVPVGYGSGLQLRTLTSTYNRFPLSREELATPVINVAVNTRPSDAWGETALAVVLESCVPRDTGADADLADYQVFACPPSALTSSSDGGT